MTKLLFIGDIVGESGRKAIAAALPGLREEHQPDFVIVNGENAAGGIGITEKIARELFAQQVDVITLGNHSFRQRDVYSYLNSEQRIVRPINYHKGNPGHGAAIVENNGIRLGVINLAGVVAMDQAGSPFDAIDQALPELDRQVDLVLVDFHAETTSEKVAIGWYLDGRVAAVVGTHTHVPTADARILPDGTAVISDVGMTGSCAGVIGVVKEAVITRMRTGMPAKFEPATGDEHVMGVVIEVARDGKASSIEPFVMPVEIKLSVA